GPHEMAEERPLLPGELGRCLITQGLNCFAVHGIPGVSVKESAHYRRGDSACEPRTWDGTELGEESRWVRCRAGESAASLGFTISKLRTKGAAANECAANPCIFRSSRRDAFLACSFRPPGIACDLGTKPKKLAALGPEILSPQTRPWGGRACSDEL